MRLRYLIWDNDEKYHINDWFGALVMRKCVNHVANDFL